MKTIQEPKTKAINELLWQATRQKTSFASYKAACRALKVLDVPEQARLHALSRLDYIKWDTWQPYEWLEKAIAAKAAKKAAKGKP